MLGVVFSLPVCFGFVVWRSYRSAGARARRGEILGTPGAERWEARDVRSKGPRGGE